jgi:choline-sulfatase
MLRKGGFKYTHVEHDPPQLFDMLSDPNETRDLAKDPMHAPVLNDFEAEVARRWDMERLKSEILRSQRRRRLVYGALMTGTVYPWDFQPWQDAAKLYYRGTKSYHEAEERDLLAP